MQALLSFDQAPPFTAPVRFFVTAPLFAMLAGVLILFVGPELFVSRWTATALAATHLLSLGFLSQVMIGAMVQILPVVAGAHIPRSLAVARMVHLALICGTLLLVLGFLTFNRLAFISAAWALGVGMVIFIGAAGHALFTVSSNNPTIRGLKLSLLGLSGTVILGLLLALSLSESWPLPLPQLTALHFGWGVVGWGITLLIAVALVVVPMFQLTPPYPKWLAQTFCPLALLLLALQTMANLAGWSVTADSLASTLATGAALFAGETLRLQRKSTRPSFDVSQQFWRLAMACVIVASALWMGLLWLPALAEQPRWAMLCGVLIFVGGFMSVMNGMLYKIVPFLVWLHLQNLCRPGEMAPNMNKVIAAKQITWQWRAHLGALLLLLAAATLPNGFAYSAGAALLVANGWLLYNRFTAMVFYRRHAARLTIASENDGQ